MTARFEPAAAALAAVQDFWRFVDNTAGKNADFSSVVASAHGMVASGGASALVRSGRSMRQVRSGRAAHSAPAATSRSISGIAGIANDSQDARASSASLVHHLEAQPASRRRSSSMSHVNFTTPAAAIPPEASPFDEHVASAPAPAPAASSQREAFRARYPPAAPNNSWLQRIGPALIGSYGVRGREKVSPEPPTTSPQATLAMTQRADSRDGRPGTPLAATLATATLPTLRSTRRRFGRQLMQTLRQTGEAHDKHADIAGSQLPSETHSSGSDAGCPGKAWPTFVDDDGSAGARQSGDDAEAAHAVELAQARPAKRTPPRLLHRPAMPDEQQLHEQVRFHS